MEKKSLNTFAGHVPKPDWIKEFFDTGIIVPSGENQATRFRQFLFDSELLKKGKKRLPTTKLYDLVKSVGWYSETAWGLILINLVYNNPQFRFYVENLPVDEEFSRLSVGKKLQDLGVSAKDANCITSSFKKFCETPLGTVLNFGKTTTKGRILDSLTRTKANITDGRVFLYGLYKFAEACGGNYQFTLSKLMDTGTESQGVSPIKIFGISRDKAEQFLNGLNATRREFISATFTHDLEKISLKSDKSSADVLELFY